ncbi:hypothetical protein MJG53_019445 [Ovis ammon polii x Ovis aries]|uniref:Uncharacterized protein n=1 Tax=Ovis ammon polii x Ovis aries TaxID=2918886 RepID=A0ACB9TZS8_9CETA|nr:hypothetical protein MJG53_019445 [Ovis ammon polii x Ovis aries]
MQSRWELEVQSAPPCLRVRTVLPACGSAAVCKAQDHISHPPLSPKTKPTSHNQACVDLHDCTELIFLLLLTFLLCCFEITRYQCTLKRGGGSSGKNVILPAVFKAPIRPDIVNFVHTNVCKNNRQPYAVCELSEDNPAMDLAKHVDSSIASSKTICLTVPPCSLTDLLSSSACVFSASTPQIKRPVDILFAYYRHFFKKEKANQRQSRDGITDSMTLHRECPF